MKATESTASLEAGLQGFGLLWRPKPALLGPVGTVTGIIAGPLSIRSVPALWWIPVVPSDFIGTKGSVSPIQPALLSAPQCSEHNQYTITMDYFGSFYGKARYLIQDAQPLMVESMFYVIMTDLSGIFADYRDDLAAAHLRIF